MAKGKQCPQCSYHMYAEREQEEAQGTWVWYRCRNTKCNFTLKEFEAKGGRVGGIAFGRQVNPQSVCH